MTQATSPGPRYLIASRSPEQARRKALAELCGPNGAGGPTTDFTFAGVASAPSDLDRYDGVVLDGPHEPDAHALHQWVEQGGSLLVVAPGKRPRHGEWMVKVSAPDHPCTARLPAELAVTCDFQPVDAGPDAAVLLSVSIGLRDEPAAVTQAVGAGRITTTGLTAGIVAGCESGQWHPDVALVLGRLLRRLSAGAPARDARVTDARVPAHASAGTRDNGHSGATGRATPTPGAKPGRPAARPAVAPSRPDPDRTIGMGIVGYGPYGGMGQLHGLAARATRGLELVAACDSDPSRRKAAEDDFPGLRAHASLAELLTDDDVGLVVVATPPVSHAGIATAALRAGKHVAMEKPMCLTLAEADQLAALASERHLTLTVNQNRRWDPDFRAIQKVLATGLLGELFCLETFVGSFEHPCRAWHSEESVSGGAAYDWGSHHLDWALQLMGSPPATVSAHGHKRVWRDVTNLDQIRVHLTWADGREAEFVQSDVAAVRKPKFYLQGTAGTLVGHYRPFTTQRIEAGRGYVAETPHHAEAPAELTLARYEPGWGLTQSTLPALAPLDYPFHRNLADHLLLGEPLAVTPESVRPVIAVLEAASRSAAAGGDPVALSLLDART